MSDGVALHILSKSKKKLALPKPSFRVEEFDKKDAILHKKTISELPKNFIRRESNEFNYIPCAIIGHEVVDIDDNASSQKKESTMDNSYNPN